MDINVIMEDLKRIRMSPIRRVLKEHSGLTVFEAERGRLKEIDKIIKANLDNINTPINVVVLGEVKAGKSTLVNALAGKRVSYTNVVEATASIIEIRYSEEELYTINKKDGTTSKFHTQEQLDSLLERNRDNQSFFEEISSIRINKKTERLKNLTLVDTPGLNTITTENSRRTEEYIKNADVLLWVLNARHPGKRSILDAINNMADYGKPIICAVNRIDETDASPERIMEEFEDQLGYMVDRIFLTNAREAWELVLGEGKAERESTGVEELCEYLINNIDSEDKELKRKLVFEALESQLTQDRRLHEKANSNVSNMINKLNEDMEAFKKHSKDIRAEINKKLEEWIEGSTFLSKERSMLNNCSEKEFGEKLKKYSGESHIKDIASGKLDELCKYIYDDWRTFSEHRFSEYKYDSSTIGYDYTAYDYNISDSGDVGKDIITGLKEGGITAGAAGLALAGWAAWLGPSAAVVTIGSAAAAFVPPFLIAGAVIGAGMRVFRKGKFEAKKSETIRDFQEDMRAIFKENIIPKIKESLYQANDHYKDDSIKRLCSVLSQCNTSFEELKTIRQQIHLYIEGSLVYEQEEGSNRNINYERNYEREDIAKQFLD